MSTYPNYIRTLLLNEAIGLPDTLAEEYVSPDYVPRQLPKEFEKVRRILFGGAPDRQMLNFRLYQLMQLLHATELEEYVLQHDDRITYLPFDRDELFNSAFGSEVTPTPGVTGELTVIGDLEPDQANGLLFHHWRILVINANTVSITKYTPTSVSTTETYTLTNGRSQNIELPDSTLQFNFVGGAGDEWTIESTARPTRGMAEILATLEASLSSDDEDAIFGRAKVEPYLTFWNCWNSHEQYAYQLGGLLLAIAFRTMDLTP